ncbi:AraC family transcriptional regulator [Citrobacter amalonaticus]|nr:helix-turn-helix transcriptional regulator [Citrobacter amalonaticus]HAT3924174.1 AraC family transcriptional regulator [Citrobacter amalonaticus]
MKSTSLFENINLDSSSMVFRQKDTAVAHYYHWHPCLEIIYILSGYGLVVVDNQQYTARPGRMFIFPPFRLHKVQITGSEKHPYVRTIVHIDQTQILNALESFPRHCKHFRYLSSDSSPAQAYDLSDKMDFVVTTLKQFEEINAGPDYHISEVMLLIMQVMNFLPEADNSFRKKDVTLSTHIMEWVERHYFERLSLEWLSAELGFSPGYISKTFRAQTGGTIQEYILCRRIKEGCDLLQTSDLSVAEIAESVGFKDVTYFITRFKKLMKYTPLQYKKIHGEH